ncbi:MAG: heme ABC transporter ATP-binding protein [Verrucomicrobia bacterium]|nr:heme ABC transporter ATP-binding protein [Verrucomicrobiota bacterium]
MLCSDNISITRSKKFLLRDVSCSFAPGSLTVVLGPNGAGKSSLLRVLSGEWVADSGRVSLLGRCLQDWDAVALARKRAVLGQEIHLRFAFSVLDVVLMGRLPHSPNGDGPHDLEIAMRALERMDVAHLAERLFPTLSGGEKQRIHLARVWAQISNGSASDARFLLLDEPTNNLDPAHQFALMEEIKALTQLGVGVVAVLHDLNLAAQFADQVMLMHAGRNAGFGSPCEILSPEKILEVFALNAEWIAASEGFGPVLRFCARR